MSVRFPAAAISVILCAAAFSAYGGPVYQLVGGICTDGTPPDLGLPPLCSHNITVTVEMVDGYVPGTPFTVSSQGPEPSPVALLVFSDGFENLTADFPIGAFGQGNSGVMPESTGRTGLHIHWFDGLFFDTEADGTWRFGEELALLNYFSSGTYEEWALVPEPPSLALIGVAFAGFFFAGSRVRPV
jgi:hypothetical protein